MNIKVIGEIEKKDDGMCDYCHENRRVYFPNNIGNLSRRLGMCNVCKIKKQKLEQERARNKKEITNKVNNQLNMRSNSRYSKW